ncbi:MAG TPA: tagaturonate epimerase family protein [bacterium]|nr:tagaturonate epimerase family protein [bacterium]
MEAEQNENEVVHDTGDLKTGTNYLGARHHPALGIRIPEIFLTGIINSLQKHRCAAGLMLSFGRETAPEEIIMAPPRRYEITLGHTGTSIRRYLTMGARMARTTGIPVEMEADHLIITESSALAVKRIEGVKTPKFVGNAAVEKSMRYNMQALDEAVATGVVRSFTTDTSDLFDTDVERLKEYSLRKLLHAEYSESERERIAKTYAGRHRFKGGDGKPVRLELSRDKAYRLALKYKRSIEINERIYQEIAQRMRRPFGFEISMDETEKPTPGADLFVYLGEWKNKGLPCDYVAPNVGFRKREDYKEGLDMLKNRVRAAHAIASRYGAMLSFHSGSGAGTHTGKGKGVYETLLGCTGNKLKYKISGIYYELLIELLAGHKKGTDARILFELIFRDLMDYLREQLETRGPLYSNVLVKQMQSFDESKKDYDPRADVFRYHSFLALNFRDQKGRRYYRDRLIRLYSEDLKLKKQVDQEIEALTARLVEGLEFGGNY